MAERIEKSDAEWREQLTPEQYRILRQKGTERAFAGEYNEAKEEGTYRCAGCGTELFSSGTKFDSGTGWPSFYAPLSQENIREETDVTQRDAPHGGDVRRLRRTPGARVPGRATADGTALLPQLRRAQAGEEGVGRR